MGWEDNYGGIERCGYKKEERTTDHTRQEGNKEESFTGRPEPRKERKLSSEKRIECGCIYIYIYTLSLARSPRDVATSSLDRAAAVAMTSSACDIT